MKRFDKKFMEMKEAVEHIPYAISGSEIDSDLAFIEKTAKELMKLRKVM